MKTRKITILGSTGSIGQNVIKIITNNSKDWQVEALSANHNFELLAAQAKLVNAKIAVIKDSNLLPNLKAALIGTNIKALSGANSLIEIAALDNDLVVLAIVGIDGLAPAFAAIKAKANLALANKEALVCGNKLLIEAAKKNKVKIIPIDSEHTAIFQILNSQQIKKVDKIILTASGGPFLHHSISALEQVTKAEALKHPKWLMGPKITVDSATMINKCLELIEAHYLYGLSSEKLEIIIHPESIIHSLVTYCDGSVLAQMSNTDMLIPINYALYWPTRKALLEQHLDFEKVNQLNFIKPDLAKFPSLQMVREVLQQNSAYSVVMNGANEAAVKAFLADKITFIQIVQIILECLNRFNFNEANNLEEILAIDQQTKNYANLLIKKLN